MSEIGKKMDVEDVLSSIRRLVSDEARATADADETEKTPSDSSTDLLQQGNAKERDKLVLTPSLRIEDPAPAAPATADIEQRIADIESLVMSEAMELPENTLDESVEVQNVELEATATTDATDADDTDYNDEAATTEMMSALNLSMKEFVRAEPPMTANLSDAPSAEEEPDPSIEPEQQEAPAPLKLVKNAEAAADWDEEDVSIAVEQDELEGSAIASDSPFAPDLDDVPPEPEFMSHAKAVAEAAMEAEAEDTSEPEMDTERETLIHREPPLTAETAAPFASAEEPMDYTEDDTFLDEETLREMVSEMVRSELQGELGDRITRNVRKLVRREIHRALASRDFE